MKLIIDIHEEQYEFIKQGMSIDKITQFPALMEAICEHITNGIPLDDVKAEIEKLNPVDYGSMFSYESHNGAKDMQIDVLQILDNISKEREVKPNDNT